jgi:hypothetical protein
MGEPCGGGFGDVVEPGDSGEHPDNIAAAISTIHTLNAIGLPAI